MKNHSIFMLAILILCSLHGLAQDAGFTGYATAQVPLTGKVDIQTFGFQDKAEQISYSKTTIQPVGSVSKTFIGISLMIAQEKGLLDLETDINNYLDFEVKNPNIKGENIITLRHLATHTSGIKDVAKAYHLAYSKGTEPDLSLQNFLINYLTAEGENFSKKNFDKSLSGNAYNYSNIGSALAAYIIERVSQMPFSEFTKAHIFDPLEMINTGWFYSEIDISRHATLYGEDDEALDPYTLITYPDGGLKTTIEDLSKFLTELMKGYQKDADLLSPESWNTLFEKNFSDREVAGVSSKEPDSGLFMVYFKSEKIGHTGSDPGVSCIMMFDPKTSIGQIFMGNEDITEQNIDTFKGIWANLN